MRRLVALASAAVLVAGALPLAAQPAVRLPAADRALPGPPAPLFSVGRAEGNPHETFARVAGVAFDARNNLYVLDGGNRRVEVFDARGRWVRTLGGPGSGPGEFIAPLQVAAMPDGRVVVSDLARRAFSVFGADGRHVGTVPFAVERALTGDRVAPYPRGGVLTTAQTLGGIGGPGAPAQGSVSLVWQPLNGGGRPHTLFQAASATAAGRTSHAQGARLAGAGSVVYAPRLHYGVFSSGAVAVSYGTGYSIQVTGAGPSNSTQRVLQRAIEPRRVTEADREAARRVRRGGPAAVAGPGPAAALRRASTEGMVFADVMPVIQGMAADREGRLWVQRSPPARGRSGPWTC